MASISGAATRSSFGNVTATLGCELSSCTRASSTTKNISFTIRSYINTGSSWSYNSWWTWIDGKIYKNFTTSGSAHTNSNQNYYSDWVTLTKECTSTSYSFSIGVNGSWWNPEAYGAKDSVTFTISGVPAYNPVSTPTINAPTIGTKTRTTAAASFSVANNGGASITDNYIDAFSDSGLNNKVSTITGTSGTFTGLSEGTTYWARANASNGTYRGYSSSTSFTTTTGAAPSVSVSHSNVSRTSATISASATYASDASHSSTTYEYGTSTSYGSTDSDGALTGLTPNTTYYYRITVKDNWGKSGSNTGSFKTTGNNPTVTSSVANITYNSAKVNYSATYDTNASYSSYTLVYGTSTSYGSTASSQNITGLNPNTTYYYKITVKDNQGRSGESTGSFTTSKPAAPTINSITANASNAGAVTVTINATVGDGATSLQYRFSKDNGSTYTSWQTGNSYTFTGLADDTAYTFKAQVKDNYETTSTSSSTSATTQWTESLKMITSSGVKPVRLYVVTSSGVTKIHKRNIKTI